MELNITRDEAMALLKKYNKEDFHILHALTVEGVMRYFAETLGYEDDADFWAVCGLLHDVDFECFPDLHCKKAPELLAEINASDDIVHAVCSHGYGICCDVEPRHETANSKCRFYRGLRAFFEQEKSICPPFAHKKFLPTKLL